MFQGLVKEGGEAGGGVFFGDVVEVYIGGKSFGGAIAWCVAGDAACFVEEFVSGIGVGFFDGGKSFAVEGEEVGGEGGGEFGFFLWGFICHEVGHFRAGDVCGRVGDVVLEEVGV